MEKPAAYSLNICRKPAATTTSKPITTLSWSVEPLSKPTSSEEAEEDAAMQERWYMRLEFAGFLGLLGACLRSWPRVGC